jgi:hypothetical protein
MSEQQPNPAINSIVDKVLQDRAAREDQAIIIAENIEEYKKALNGMAGSEYGRFVLRKLIRYCGIHTFDTRPDPVKALEDNGKRKVYLELIRPYLDAEIRAEIERETA